MEGWGCGEILQLAGSAHHLIRELEDIMEHKNPYISLAEWEDGGSLRFIHGLVYRMSCYKTVNRC